MNAPDYVRLLEGNPEKTEEFINLFEKNLDAALNEYSRPMEFNADFMLETEINDESAKKHDGEDHGEN